MENCELCGSEGQLATAEIEGTDMEVCEGCSELGTVKGSFGSDEGQDDVSRVVNDSSSSSREVESEERVVSDYSSRVKEAREGRGLSQEDFADSINEKRSVISKVEKGSFDPPLDLARKLEDALGITLVEEVSEESAEGFESSDDEVTIGDVIKIEG